MTTEQWENLNDRAWRVSTPEHKCSVGKTRYVDSGTWAVWDPYPTLHGWVDFDPTVAEARAVLRMPGRNPEAPYTREAVHAHIRAHGTVEECEAAFRDAVDEHESTVCPGCGKYAWSEECDDERVAWHRDCLARVRSRTEAARSGKPEPRLCIYCKNEDGTTVCHHCGFDRREAPAPVQPVEPRPFRVGDRVQLRFGKQPGTIVGVSEGPARVHVRYDDDTPDDLAGPPWCYAAEHLTLVTHAPEEPQDDRAPVHESTLDGTGDEARAYDEGGTNPAGFPVMPKGTSVLTGVCKCGRETSDPWPDVVRKDGWWVCKTCHDEQALAGTASVVLPFDAFMRAREQQEPEPYDPREGDEVEVSPPGCPPYAAVVAGVDSKWGVRVWCSDRLARVTDVQWCRLVRRGGVR